jgi:DNA-binding SARP family transcriptional activator/tRNA A-37 threonylcarbamoyl transferase component Bud32
MIELITLGASSIRQDGAERKGLSGHKQKLALLSYIAVEGPVSRDKLLGMFWPEKPEGKASHSLSQALHALRKELGEDCLLANGGQVDLGDTVTVDVKRMQAAGQQERWDEVVELYRGPFLDQFYLPETPSFDDWQSRTRAWVSSFARKGFEKAIAARYASGDIAGALDVAWHWAKLEPLEDEAQHALIALLAVSGDRALALDQYEAYRQRLDRELNVQPLEETVTMVEGIRSGLSPEHPLLGEMSKADVSERATPPSADSEPQVVTAENIDQLVREELAPRLQIIRKLGQSPTSNIYLADEPGLKRRVAVKVFSPRLASDRRARMRFEREVLAVASLTHPNIAALHWAGSLSNGLPYFVMQYVDGPSMADKLRVEGRLTNEHARQFLAQVASALASAHRRGIIHRDVQPANILCDEESRRCLLTDFGIAGILAKAGEAAVKITRTDEQVSDPVWMSPEQAKAHVASERSDIYSLGLLGYQVLAEDSPYTWTTKQELYEAHVKGRPRSLSELRPDVDPELEGLLEQCLAKEPRSRPSASQIAGQLSSPREEKLPEDVEPEGIIARLFWRRVPHWLGAYLAGGYAIVELVQIVAERGHLGVGAIDITLISYLLGAPIVSILAWYHGRAGPQRVERLEYGLLSAVGLIWLALLAAIWLV